MAADGFTTHRQHSSAQELLDQGSARRDASFG